MIACLLLSFQDKVISVPFEPNRSIHADGNEIALRAQEETTYYSAKNGTVVRKIPQHLLPRSLEPEPYLELFGTRERWAFSEGERMDPSSLEPLYQTFRETTVYYLDTAIIVQWGRGVWKAQKISEEYVSVLPIESERKIVASRRWVDDPHHLSLIDQNSETEKSLPLVDNKGKLLNRVTSEVAYITDKSVGVFVKASDFEEFLSKIPNLRNHNKKMPSRFVDAVLVEVDLISGLCKPLARTDIEAPTHDPDNMVLRWQRSCSIVDGFAYILSYDIIWIVKL